MLDGNPCFVPLVKTACMQERALEFILKVKSYARSRIEHYGINLTQNLVLSYIYNMGLPVRIEVSNHQPSQGRLIKKGLN